jgi:hypothetical protein
MGSGPYWEAFCSVIAVVEDTAGMPDTFNCRLRFRVDKFERQEGGRASPRAPALICIHHEY